MKYIVLRKIYRFSKQIIKSFKIAYYFIAGQLRKCNICNYQSNKLNSDNWHLYSICPKCGSSVRSRLLWASLTNIDNVKLEKLIKNKDVLHFAPEYILRDHFKNNAKIYKTADFFAAGYVYDEIDYNLDISNMPQIKDSEFDCVIACDVLEHVPNHIDGIKEVYRILRKGGCCIFTVPQKDNLEVTFEDPSITEPKEREQIFGQSDHLRIYGNDFSKLLTDCGFEVVSINEENFNPKKVKRLVLFPPILSKHPLATNYRKVFFGFKN
jgi:SAM-dependent methyltransferase